MKLLYSEFPANYNNYRFPYQVWAWEESVDERDNLLNQGFLPSRIKVGLWYLARSIRVDVSRYNRSSENRRVVKNTAQYSFSFHPTEQFRLSQEQFKWVERFVLETLKLNNYSLSSIKRIFSPHWSSYIMVCRRQGDQESCGLAPILKVNRSLFYWLGFYRSDRFVTGLGSRLMLEAIEWARQSQHEYIYLGTIYRESSLYKTNYKGWEFFNGFEWSQDKKQLRYLIDKDKNSEHSELMKDSQFLNEYYQCRDVFGLIKKVV